jgi:hypothetical protein
MTRRSDERLVDDQVLEVVVPFCFERDGEVVVVPENTRLRADDPLVKRFPAEWFTPQRLRSP